MKSDLSNNILKINVYALLCGMRFSLPIVFFDLKERGFSYSEIGFFFSIQAIASLLFEIPAGTIADRFGSKWSLALSSLGLATTYIFIATLSILTTNGIHYQYGFPNLHNFNNTIT